jgi:hypothetical protein
MDYQELKNKHREKVNNFPMFFAFSEKQFAEGMEKLGLNPDDTDKIYKIGGGGFIRKSDSKDFGDMLDGFNRDLQELIADDDALHEALVYELGNHEYCITGDPTDALGVLNLSTDDLKKDERLQRILNTAIRDYMDSVKNNC